jgi:hypothetical protein
MALCFYTNHRTFRMRKQFVSQNNQHLTPEQRDKLKLYKGDDLCQTRKKYN